MDAISQICFLVFIAIFCPDFIVFFRWIYFEKIGGQICRNLSRSCLRCGFSHWIGMDFVDSCGLLCLFWLAAKNPWQFSDEIQSVDGTNLTLDGFQFRFPMSKKSSKAVWNLYCRQPNPFAKHCKNTKKQRSKQIPSNQSVFL